MKPKMENPKIFEKKFDKMATSQIDMSEQWKQETEKCIDKVKKRHETDDEILKDYLKQ